MRQNGWDLYSTVQSEYGDNSLDKDRGLLYNAEIWEPMAFGYVGAGCEFTSDGTLEAFGVWQAEKQGISQEDIANALTDDDAKGYADDSQLAIVTIGFRIWAKFGIEISRNDIFSAVGRNTSELNAQQAQEGIPPVSLRTT